MFSGKIFFIQLMFLVVKADRLGRREIFRQCFHKSPVELLNAPIGGEGGKVDEGG